MTWGPGQGTELHDHAGIWCVECVLDGELAVTQFDLVESRDDRYRFERRQSVRAGIGTAGCLIPPFEYHTLSNALPGRSTVTVHVYGGEMDCCNTYRPDGSGWWSRIAKRLDYAT
jgi:predicted metal-dependent enzyme (double-stranded beta helix superfamily)